MFTSRGTSHALLLVAACVACSSTQPHTETFTLKAISCGVPHTPCKTVTPAGAPLGEYMLFGVPFTDGATGQAAGVDDGYCVLVQTVPARYVCTKTATLDEGSIVYGGVYVPADDVSQFAVQGGTGKFSGARGTVCVYPDADRVALVFILIGRDVALDSASLAPCRPRRQGR
jgi:hypothetical protein